MRKLQSALERRKRACKLAPTVSALTVRAFPEPEHVRNMEETTRLLDQWGFLLVRALRRNQSQSESLLELVRVGLEVVGMGGGRGKQVIETWRV